MKPKVESKEFLEVRIFQVSNLNEIIYYGKALSVSSENKLGRFDVLFGHSNFISLVFKNMSIVTLENGKKMTHSFSFDKGVLEVVKNRVNIFLGL